MTYVVRVWSEFSNIWQSGILKENNRISTTKTQMPLRNAFFFCPLCIVRRKTINEKYNVSPSATNIGENTCHHDRLTPSTFSIINMEHISKANVCMQISNEENPIHLITSLVAKSILVSQVLSTSLQ